MKPRFPWSVASLLTLYPSPHFVVQASAGSPPRLVCSTDEDTGQVLCVARTIAPVHSANRMPGATRAGGTASVRSVAGSVKLAKAAESSPCSFLPFQATIASASDEALVRVTRKPYFCEVNFCGGATGCVVATAFVSVGCVGAACVACEAGLLPDEPQPAAAATVAMAISASGNARLSCVASMWMSLM